MLLFPEYPVLPAKSKQLYNYMLVSVIIVICPLHIDMFTVLVTNCVSQWTHSILPMFRMREMNWEHLPRSVMWMCPKRTAIGKEYTLSETRRCQYFNSNIGQHTSCFYKAESWGCIGVTKILSYIHEYNEVVKSHKNHSSNHYQSILLNITSMFQIEACMIRQLIRITLKD